MSNLMIRPDGLLAFGPTGLLIGGKLHGRHKLHHSHSDVIMIKGPSSKGGKQMKGGVVSNNLGPIKFFF